MELFSSADAADAVKGFSAASIRNAFIRFKPPRVSEAEVERWNKPMGAWRNRCQEDFPEIDLQEQEDQFLAPMGLSSLRKIQGDPQSILPKRGSKGSGNFQARWCRFFSGYRKRPDGQPPKHARQE